MQNEERINVLETQVRTLKRIVYGFGCLLVAGVIVSATSMQTIPDVIQAKKFEVVNDEGRMVVSLGAPGDGGGGLFISDNKGRPSVMLISDSSMPGLVIFHDGKGAARISADADGGNWVIYNKDEKTVASLFTYTDGGRLSINNKDGKSVAKIFVIDNGGGFGMNNKNGQPFVMLGTNVAGDGKFTILNSKGEITTSLP